MTFNDYEETQKIIEALLSQNVPDLPAKVQTAIDGAATGAELLMGIRFCLYQVPPGAVSAGNFREYQLHAVSTGQMQLETTKICPKMTRYNGHKLVLDFDPQLVSGLFSRRVFACSQRRSTVGLAAAKCRDHDRRRRILSLGMRMPLLL